MRISWQDIFRFNVQIMELVEIVPISDGVHHLDTLKVSLSFSLESSDRAYAAMLQSKWER